MDAEVRFPAVVGADLDSAGDLHHAGPPRVGTGQVVDDDGRATGGLGVVVLARLGEVEAADDDDVTVEAEPNGRRVGLALSGDGGDATKALAVEVLELGVGEHHRSWPTTAFA